MNIFLTGGAGYIGSRTAVALFEAGHNFVIFDNYSNSTEVAILGLTKIINNKVNFVYGDIRDGALIEKTLITEKIDLVMHFAGLKSVGDSWVSPISYYDNNVLGTIELIKAMERASVFSLIFSGSATVYGVPKYLPIDESHPILPTNPYGRNKNQIKQILSDVAIGSDMWSSGILRYFNPAGSHESCLIGEQPRGLPNNLMPYILRVASGEYPFLNIYGGNYDTPNGTGARDFIHVEDLAIGHVSMINFLSKNSGFHVFNLGSGTCHTVLQVVNQFIQSTGVSIEWKLEPRRKGDVAICYADISNAKASLDWGPKQDIDDICRSAWGFWKNEFRKPK